jgi:hypothetical protein
LGADEIAAAADEDAGFASFSMIGGLEFIEHGFVTL